MSDRSAERDSAARTGGGNAMHQRRSLAWLAALIGAGVFSLGARQLAAQAPPGKPAPPGSPALQGETTVDADQFDFDNDHQLVIGTGDVVVVAPRGPVTADRLTLKKTPEGGIDWIKVAGHVTLDRKNPGKSDSQPGSTMHATGDTGEYYEQAQKANLVGNVVLHFSSADLAEPAVITG